MKPHRKARPRTHHSSRRTHGEVPRVGRLWAPWRMEYIRKGNSQPCIFCALPPEKNSDETNLILFRGESSFIMMNRFPYNNAHLMVAPYRHTADLLALAPSEREQITTLIGHIVSILKTVYKADGLNVGVNLGRAAGAGFEDHLHFHVVPRWVGDTNFMPVLGESKVVSQALDETYRFLLPHFRSLHAR